MADAVTGILSKFETVAGERIARVAVPRPNGSRGLVTLFPPLPRLKIGERLQIERDEAGRWFLKDRA